MLVSGPLPPDPGEFAASYRLAEILAQLRNMYDTVVVDTPPLLWVGDALDALLAGRRDDRDHADEGASAADAPRATPDPRLAPARKLGFVITGPGRGGARRLQLQGRLLVRYGYGSAARGRRVAEPAGGEKLGSFDGVRSPQPLREGSIRVKATGNDGLSSSQYRRSQTCLSKA